MKKIKLMIGITIGILISGMVGVTAATLISSSQVLYKDDMTVEDGLNNLYDELLVGKQKLAQSITNKGVETSSEDTFDTMANNVNSISNINSNRTYYYKRGVFADGVTISSTSSTYGKYTINEDNVEITYSPNGNGMVSFTNIDVTDINYLYFDIHYPSAGRPGITMNNTSLMYWGGNILDVSEYTGMHSFGFHSCTGMKIYNVYGVKEIE